MRRNPHVNVLFDEVEKAHPDVFNVLLQVLDDGRLTDNRGLTVSFSEANIVMTTNIGQTALLDRNLSFEEARNETFLELDKFFRPEFLNRFNGRQNIVCFNRLELPIIEMIAKREIRKINERIAAQDRKLVVTMDDVTISALCRDQYEPARGARGLPGYFTATIYPAVERTILSQEDASGVMTVTYDTNDRKVHVSGPEPKADV
jgi:ATP-dependent Clp protease ATP-binding subunit ClpB